MGNVESVAKAVGAALFLAWAVFTEWRLQCAQRSLEKDRMEVNDEKITLDVHSESDSALKSALDKNLGTVNGQSKT